MKNLTLSKSIETATTQELLAEIIGQNSASKILATFDSLSFIARFGDNELSRLAGVSTKRARQVRAAMLLAKKLTVDAPASKPMLDTPELVADVLRENCRGYGVETFHLLLLDTRRRLIRLVKISEGTLDTLLVHPREIFKPAILWSASALILAHNHPSGDPTPSDADVKVTRDLIRAGQLLKIDVLDHVILGQRTTERPKDFSSLRELGFFYL